MQPYLQEGLRAQLIDRRQRLSEAVDHAADARNLVDLLKQVDAALERMDRGTYGLCEACHDPIEQDRLLADPLLRFCLGDLDDRQRTALQQDLELASRIQARLLPAREFRTKHWEACYHYEPAGAVSGDYCELISPEPGSGRLFFAIGDVSGKGVAASLVMAHLQAVLRGLAVSGLPLKETVQRANRMLCGSAIPSAFTTLVCGWADESGDVELCNAGHCTPLVFPDGAGFRLEAGGLPLGLFAEADYSTERLRLAPNQGLLLYTDGVTEAANSTDEQFGPDRLATFLQSHADLPGPELLSACRRRIAEFTADTSKADDLTILALRRFGLRVN